MLSGYHVTGRGRNNYLASRGYKVWLFDISGYGRSGKVKDGFMVDSDYAAEDIAEAAKTILEKEKVSKIDVLGWSWGTVTTLPTICSLTRTAFQSGRL